MRLLVEGENKAVVIGPAMEAEEIAQNVRMILTTPKGTVPLDRDFGLDFDFIDRPTPRARALMAVEIVRQVGKYEPRAKVVKVDWQDDPTAAMDGRLLPVITIDILEAAR